MEKKISHSGLIVTKTSTLRTPSGTQRHSGTEIFPEPFQGRTKKRFIERLERPEKNWKFSAADLAERGHWDDYQEAYEDAINSTSTKWAPWHIIPADNKWATRALVADIITSSLRDLDLKFPEVTEAQLKILAEARKKLDEE